MNVLLDTNVILDYVLKRELGIDNANRIWQATVSSQIKGYVTASSMTDIYYYASNRGKDEEVGRSAIVMCITTLEICTVDRTIIEEASNMKRHDFEDAVQIACARAEGLDAIVTSNIKDFRNAGIKLYTPAQLAKELKIR